MTIKEAGVRLTDLLAPSRQPPGAVPDTPAGRTGVLGKAGLYAGGGPQVVSISPAAHGWWIRTHGGGPDSSAVPPRRTRHGGTARLCGQGR